MSRDAERLTEKFQIDSMEKVRSFLGRQDRHLRLLRDAFGIRVIMRGQELILDGEPASVRSAARAVREILDSLHRSPHLSTSEVESAIAAADEVEQGANNIRIDVFAPGRAIRPRTPGQAAYLRAIAENDLEIGRAHV